MATRIHYPDDRNPRDPYAQARKMAVTWACLTLRKIGVEFINEGGWWNVCTPWGWETADNGSELSTIARKCLAYVRECDRVEGPVPL